MRDMLLKIVDEDVDISAPKSSEMLRCRVLSHAQKSLRNSEELKCFMLVSSHSHEKEYVDSPWYGSG